MKNGTFTGLLAMVWVMTCGACHSSASNGGGGENSTLPASPPAKDSLPHTALEGEPDFGNFLRHFPDDRDWSGWAYQPQHLLLYEDAVYAPDRGMLDKVLDANFVAITDPYVKHLRLAVLEKTEKPWCEYQNRHPEPARTFKFYAYAKLRRDGHWLLSYFARNVAEDRKDIFEHAFVLASYTHDGSPVDEFVWWWAEDDVYQLWDQAGLAGDTILEGYDPKGIEGHLEEVHRKTIITPKGQFKTVFEDKTP